MWFIFCLRFFISSKGSEEDRNKKTFLVGFCVKVAKLPFVSFTVWLKLFYECLPKTLVIVSWRATNFFFSELTYCLKRHTIKKNQKLHFPKDFDSRVLPFYCNQASLFILWFCQSKSWKQKSLLLCTTIFLNPP